MFAARATPEGTARYAVRFPGYSGFYRQTNSWTVSSIGLGTYLGGMDDEADRSYIRAIRAAVETARVQAVSQQVYLERVSNPSAPDYPVYPWRVLWSAVTAVAGCMTWRMWRILSADSLHHADA